MPAETAKPTSCAPPHLGRTGSTLLTLVLGLVAVAFVVTTHGTSLAGQTSFYAGGLIVNDLPWIAAEYEPVTVTSNYAGDTVDFFIPGRTQIVDRALDGDFPGWNSMQGGGSALASVPTYGLLAPTGLAWWLVPASLAPAWEKLTILLVAASGMALFLRRLGVGWHSAWLGGLVYAMSGFMIAWTNWPQAGVAAMLPWLLWSTERALQLRTWPAHVPVALSVAFLLLGGFPAVAGHGFYLTGCYVLLRLTAREAHRIPWARIGRALLALSAALVAGILLAGVQLVPFVHVFADLDTGYREDAFAQRLPYRMALTSLFPNAWGTKGGVGFFQETNPIESNTYLGAAAVVLVVVALLLPARTVVAGRVRWFLAGVVALGAALVYVQGPLLAWVGTLPVFAGNPIGRLTSVVLLAASALAGIGFDALLHGPSGKRRTTARLLAGLLTTVAAVVALALYVDRETTERVQVDAGGILLLAAGCAVVTALAGVLAHLRPTWRVAALAVVPVLVMVQGVNAAVPMWAQVDREDFYPVTPVHRFLQDRLGSDRMAVTGSAMVNGSTAYYGLRSATGHVFSTPEVQDLQQLITESGHLSATYWTIPGDAGLQVWQSPGLDRMGVRYLTSGLDGAIPGRLELASLPERDLLLPTAAAESATVPIPGGPLRGLVLELRRAPAQQSAGYVVVELIDSQGSVLLSSRRFVEFPRPPSLLYVPLAGESLAATGGLTARIHWVGPAEAPTLAADTAGRPAASVVRPEKDGLRLVYAGEAVVWERLSALPRIRWADRARVVPDPALRSTTVARAHLPADVVVLDRGGPALDGRPADLRVLEDSGDTIRVQVDAAGSGYLVVAESVQTDWSVTVDGVSADIVPADHAFGAVFVPEGRHEVTLDYTPRGGFLGVVATIAGLSALVLFCLPAAWRALRHRRQRVLAEGPERDSEGDGDAAHEQRRGDVPGGDGEHADLVRARARRDGDGEPVRRAGPWVGRGDVGP